MAIEIISGIVSHYEHATETSGRIQTTGNQVSGSVQTSHVLTFRVDGRAVAYKSYDVSNLANGDLVTVAGEKTNQGFAAYAFRNENTETIHQAPVMLFYFLLGFSCFAILLLSLLIMALNVIVGLIVLGVAGYFFIYKFLFIKTMAIKNAVKLLARTPKATVKTSQQ